MFSEKFRIVADSSADLFPEGSLDCVPLKIRSQAAEYVDDASLDVAKMVHELRATPGRTSSSCPNIHEWLSAFEGAQYIFCVTISSSLSGSYAAAMQAKADYEESHPGAKVHVVDSKSTGPEMVLLIRRIQEGIRAGKEYGELVRDIMAYQARTHLLFILHSVQNLAKNGRIHPAMAKIVGVLNIRILGKASAEGTLEILHKVRGDKGVLKKFLEELLAHGYKGGALRITHCLNEEGANTLRDAVANLFPAAPLSVDPCRGLCSYYAEQGGMLIAFESPE